jgi:hypothetical protein
VDRIGQDLPRQFVMALGQAHRHLTGGSPVQLREATGAGSTPTGQPPKLDFRVQINNGRGPFSAVP